MSSLTCSVCGEDLTAAVSKERTEELDVLRGFGRAQTSGPSAPWTVRVWCSNDHENIISGDG